MMANGDSFHSVWGRRWGAKGSSFSILTPRQRGRQRCVGVLLALKTGRLDVWRRSAVRYLVMRLADPSPRPANDPQSVKVNLTTGTGVAIDWKDGHRSSYPFPFLRDACPCALCDDEREKSGREAGEALKLAPGALPLFKAAAKALGAEPVGKYALRLAWNDNHDLGIYSWAYLREICPCAECRSAARG